MLLRESGRISEQDVDPAALTAEDQRTTGVAGGQELIGLVDAALRQPDRLPAARDALEEQLGQEKLVEAAAVAANFQRMTRIADATGIPVDTPMAMMTAKLREEIGVNRFASAKNTPPLNLAQRAIARILQPLIPTLLKRFAPKPEDLPGAEPTTES